MSIPAQSMKVVLHANLDGTNEEAETGFWMVGADVPLSEAAAQLFCDNIRDAFAAHYSPIKALLSTDCAYDVVRLYVYPTGGSVASFVAISPISGGTGSGSATAPLQQSLVVTLRTGFSGRRRRGRMYLPACGVNAGAGHTMPSTPVNDATDAVAAFFTDLNAIREMKVSVVSTTGSDSALVTEVDADYRADVQRRRANSQPTGGRHTAVV